MITNPIEFVYRYGDGNATEFSYAFNGAEGFDTKVASDVKAAILNPDGTRENNPNFAVMMDTYKNLTGFIKFATAPVDGAVIYIYRATPQTQEVQFETSSGFDAAQMTKSLDKLTKMAQELNDHTRNRVLQLDLFQQQVFQLVLMTAANQDALMFVDWATLTVRLTPWTRGQAVLTPAAGANQGPAVMLRQAVDNEGRILLEYSVNQGQTWILIGGLNTQIILQMLGSIDDLLPDDAGNAPETFVEAINAERTDRRVAVDELYSSNKPRLTGVIADTISGNITEIGDGTGLNIPGMTILFNKAVYYANSSDEFEQLEVLSQQALIPDMGTGTQKTFYLYWLINNTPLFTETLPTGDQGADRCYLGSGFALNDGSGWKIQAGSWKTQPWIPEVSLELRTDPLNSVSGIVFRPATAITMILNSFKISGEGFNFVNDQNNPNLIIFPEKNPVMFKKIYPGYSALEIETDDFTSLNVWFNIDTQTLEPVPANNYSVVVPFATPSGQILFLVQQGTTANPGYFAADLATILANMPNLQYDFTNISSRIMPLGMCWAVVSGLTDVSNDLQLFPMQDIPAQLKQYGFTSGGGSSPSITGMTLFDVNGNQIGGSGVIRELQESESVKIDLTGTRVQFKVSDVSTTATDTDATPFAVEVLPFMSWVAKVWKKINALFKKVLDNTYQGIVDLGNMGADNTIPFDNTIGAIYLLNGTAATGTRNMTLSFPATTETQAFTFELHIVCSTVIPVLNWTDNILWVDGVAPELGINSTNIITLRKQGSIIIGALAGAY